MSDDTPDCPNCTGENDATHYSYYECDNCYEPIGPVDAVPKEDLRELVGEWRMNADIDEATGRIDASDRWAQAADELEDLLDGENE